MAVFDLYWQVLLDVGGCFPKYCKLLSIHYKFFLEKFINYFFFLFFGPIGRTDFITIFEPGLMKSDSRGNMGPTHKKLYLVLDITKTIISYGSTTIIVERKGKETV